MTSSLVNWQLIKLILGQTDRYLIHFEQSKSFEKVFAYYYEGWSWYDINGKWVTFNAIQTHHRAKKKLQVNHLAAYRCQISFFIKQNRFF